MAINFSTGNQTMRQLFGNGLTYAVPRFQRDYSWTSDEWDDLWQDIQGTVSAGGEPAHYMGYLVLQSTDNKKKNLSGCDYDMESELYSIEHMLPEAPDTEWVQFSEREQEEITYRLGNMTILETSLNREAGISPSPRKRRSMPAVNLRLQRR